MSSIEDERTGGASAAATIRRRLGEGDMETTADFNELAKIGCAGAGENEGLGGIHEHMPVYAACGKKVGVVDSVQGNSLKLTREGSPDGLAHFVPTAWIGRVHEGHVHLTKTSDVTQREWMRTVSACEACAG